MNIFGLIGNFFVGLVATTLTLVGVQTPLTTGVTPGLQVSLNATQTSIVAGDSVTLSWDALNATSCNSNQFVVNGLKGNVTVSPTKTTTYTISCLDQNAPTGTATVNDPTQGTWQLVEEDYTDLFCAGFGLGTLQSVYDFIPDCPNSDPQRVCPVNQNGFCSYPNQGNPTGMACTGNDRCKINSSGSSCVVHTEIYQCSGQPASQTAIGYTWQKTNTAYTKICSANNDPNDKSTSIQQPFCDDIDAGGLSAGDTCTVPNAKCKDHAFQGQDQCSGLGTVYGNVITYKCKLPSAVDNVVTAQVTVVVTNPNNPNLPGTTGGGSNCTDGIDNDNDGLIDSADPGCSGAGSNESLDPQCADGIDNNGDGLIDYPADPRCLSNLDPFEDQLPAAVLSLDASDKLVRKFTSAKIVWTTENIQAGSCTLRGTNGDTAQVTVPTATYMTPPLEVETVYTLSCTDLLGETVTTDVTIKITPSFNEQ